MTRRHTNLGLGMRDRWLKTILLGVMTIMMRPQKMMTLLLMLSTKKFIITVPFHGRIVM